MTFMPAELPTGLVTGRYAFVTVDDPKDADYDPDMIPVTGDVTFTISAQPPIRYDGPNGHIGTIPVRVKAFFDSEGYLVAGDGRGIELPATDSPLFNPTGFTWQVAFNLRDAKGNTKVHVPGFSFTVPEGAGLDGTTPAVDLVAITPVGSSNGTQITRGASAYEVALSNGFTGTEVEWLDSLEGTASDEDVAPLINDPNSQTNAELNATFATNEYVGTLAYGTNLEATDATTATWLGDPSTDTGAKAASLFSPRLVGNQPAVRNRALTLNVKAEGAAGDGVVNDQPYIGGAHNLLGSSGGRILVPEGSYYMSTRLIVSKQGMVLQGNGVDATTMLIDAAMFQVVASDVLVRDMTIKGKGSLERSLFQLVTSGAFKNWRFENVKFDGVSVIPSRLGAIESNGSAITLGAGLDEFVEFDNCEWVNCTTDGTLGVRGTHHVTVSNSYFHDLGTDINKGDMAKFSAGAQYWKVHNTRFKNGTRDAIDCYDAHRGHIDGAVVENVGVHGVEMKVATGTPPNPADRNRVTNSHFVNTGTATPSPAMQLAIPNHIATGNMVEGGSDTGLRCGPSTDQTTKAHDIIWANNHIRGVASYGYLLTGVDGAVVQGNIAAECGSSGYHAALGAVNSRIVGGAADNLSSGNGAADVWA